MAALDRDVSWKPTQDQFQIRWVITQMIHVLSPHVLARWTGFCCLNGGRYFLRRVLFLFFCFVIYSVSLLVLRFYMFLFFSAFLPFPPSLLLCGESLCGYFVTGCLHWTSLPPGPSVPHSVFPGFPLFNLSIRSTWSFDAPWLRIIGLKLFCFLLFCFSSLACFSTCPLFCFSASLLLCFFTVLPLCCFLPFCYSSLNKPKQIKQQ